MIHADRCDTRIVNAAPFDPGKGAELLELFEWGDTPEPSHQMSEVADVLIYALLFCEAAGIDPEFSIRRKMALNAEKYPV